MRTRLTHSLETSSIGRSLGTAAGNFICREFGVDPLTPDDVGAIVAAAALGHDIGNPPLGHAGEEAIRYWFTHSRAGQDVCAQLTPQEAQDFSAYEGNAQGFRTLARLEMREQRGGMRLTCATLGAFAKYPCGAFVPRRPNGVAGKKFNFFCSESELFAEMAEHCGLVEVGPRAWQRHPLAYLVEAADDIAYLVVDFEDGLRQGLISYEELESFFIPLIDFPEAVRYADKISQPVQKAEYLRAQVIGSLVCKVIRVFEEKHDDLLAGTLEKPLTGYLECAPILNKLRERSTAAIYNNAKVTEIIAAGFEMVSGMLDILMPCIEEIACEKNGLGRASYRARRVGAMLPADTLAVNDEAWLERPYLRLLGLLDYVAGMTDSFAVSLYQKMKGISL
ncbi:MAG: dNTP triphosphohydrolase [Victivallaceae bacterium]|nr:dNTP triphosphohydrolase [Victivallaceae bacterium]